MNGLLGDNSNYGSNGWDFSDPKNPRLNLQAMQGELAFKQAMADLNAAAYRGAAVASPSGSSAAQMWAGQAGEQQKIASADPYEQLLARRNQMLTGDKDQSEINLKNAQTVTEGHRPAYVDAQTQHELAGADLTRNQANTELLRPDLVRSQINQTNAATRYNDAQTVTEGERPAQVRAATDASVATAANQRAQTETEGHRPALVDVQARAAGAGADREDQWRLHDKQTMEFDKEKNDLLNKQRAAQLLQMRSLSGGGDPAKPDAAPTDPAKRTTTTTAAAEEKLTPEQKAYRALPQYIKASIENEPDVDKQNALLSKYLSKTFEPVKVTLDDGREITRARLPDGRTVDLKDVMDVPPSENAYSKGKMTEDERKTARYTDKMTTSHQLLNQYESYGTGLKGRWEGLNSAVPGGAFASQGRQAFDNAARTFIYNTMRDESGATIQPAEFQMAYDMYIPKPSDKPEELERKRELRAQAVESNIGGAGQNYNVKPLWRKPDLKGHANLGLTARGVHDGQEYEMDRFGNVTIIGPAKD